MGMGDQVRVDVLILTCLLDELEGVLALGDGGKPGWDVREDPGGLPYHVRSIPRATGRPLHLAVAWSTDMGEVPTADRARALAQHLSPRWLAMCGICAGRRGEVALGDVIVADRVFSYDHGKLIASTGTDGERQEEIFRDITTYNLRDPWRTRAAYFARDLSWSVDLIANRPISLEQQARWLLRTLLRNEDPERHPDRRDECPDWAPTLQSLKRRGLIAYPDPSLVLTAEGRTLAQRERIESPETPLRDPPFRVHMGPIATGKTVRADPQIFDRIKQFSRKAIGIEMEAAAIGYVAERLGVLALIAKAVSDYGDHDKDDGFRAFACAASARFLLAFFLSQDLDDRASSGQTYYGAASADLGAVPKTRSGHPSDPASTTTPGLGEYQARSSPAAPTPGTQFRPGPDSPPTRTGLGTAPTPGASPTSRTVVGTEPPYVAASPFDKTSYAPQPAAPPAAVHSRTPDDRPAGITGTIFPADDGAPSSSMLDAPPLPAPVRGRIGVGTVLGSWRLLHMLGQGGMGTVYRAEHVRLGTFAAIKVLSTDHAFGSTQIAHRFLNEARAAARIRHPGVVAIYDYAIHDSGEAYIIMELLVGVELGALIAQRGRLLERDAVAIAKDIASALGAAHELGIIHRDLKPSNVFLVADPTVASGQRVKVLDFGIAKVAGDLAGDAGVTRSGMVIGTPLYMSPEQARGASTIDARTDQYSLGCLLFAMVTGRPPFGGAGAAGEVIAAHLREPPPRLGALAPVSQGLEQVVARLLAKHPTQRFRDMAEVDRALSTIAGSTLILPPSPAGAPRSTRPAAYPDERDALDAALPAHFRDDAPLIRRFLHHVADDYEAIGDSTLRLIDPRVAGAAGFEFFVLLLGGPSGGDHQLGTVTFMHHALPLEQHLEHLDRDARKVVIVVSDSFELGRGVREKILDYRNRLDALVVPIYLGELRKAERGGRHEALFMDRLADFQAVPDLYAASGPLSDPTRFFGMRHVLDELITELERPERIVMVHGLPGSGKSSLLRMADYGMTAARFVRVICAAVSPAAMVVKIISALGGSGGDLEHLKATARAWQRTPDSHVVLVLDDADPWFNAPAEPAGDVQDLVAALIDLARDRVLSTVATTVREFSLGRPVHRGRPNPLAKGIHTIELPRLDRETVARLIRDLGAQMNVTAGDRVVAECAELSGGNVDVLRRLCSGMLKRHRRDAAHHALRAVTLTRRDLQVTAGDLIAMRGTFEGLLSWLSLDERRVLHGIAVNRPGNADDLATGGLVVSDAADALEQLRAMGLAERVDGREQLTIPLLASWAKRHLRDGRTGSRWLRWLR